MWVIPYLNALSTINLTRSRNSTLLSAPPETYWGQFEEISKYNTHLNVAERLWTAWYAWMQNDVLATGIMSFMMHEIVYFGRSLPWIFIDTLGLLKNYKIQSVSGRRCEHQDISLTLAEQNTLVAGAMELCQICASQPFHSRIASNLVGMLCPLMWIVPNGVLQAISPNGSVFRTFDFGPFSVCVDNGLPNCDIFCFGRHVALFLSSRSSLGPSLQGYPQNPPPVLCPFWHGGRIRLSDWSHDFGIWNRWLSDSLVCSDWGFAHLHYVRLDCAAPIPGHWFTQRLRVSMEPSPFPSILGWRWSPWSSPWKIRWQLFQQLPVVGLLAWYRVFTWFNQAAERE